jgi:hypothetical protein
LGGGVREGWRVEKRGKYPASEHDLGVGAGADLDEKGEFLAVAGGD